MKRILMFILVLVMAPGCISVGADNPNSDPTPKLDINQPAVVNYWYNGIGFNFEPGDGWDNKSYPNDFYFSRKDNKNEYFTINWILGEGETPQDREKDALNKFVTQNSKDSVKAKLAGINKMTADDIVINDWLFEQNKNYTHETMDSLYNLKYKATAGGKNPTTVNSVFYCKFINDHLYYLEFSSNSEIDTDDYAVINAVIDSIHFSPYIDVIDVEIKNNDPIEAGLNRDIPFKHWASDVIAKWSDSGILNGYGNGRFGPDDTLTSTQFIKIICTLLGTNETELSGKAWDYKAVYTALINDLLPDYGNTDDVSPVEIDIDDIPDEKLQPIADMLKIDVASLKLILKYSDFTVTDELLNPEFIKGIVEKANKPMQRQEAFMMLANAFEIEPEESLNVDLSGFTDSDKINPAYAPYIYAMLNNKFVNGMSDTEIGPHDILTRSQAVKLVDNLTAYYVNDLSMLDNTNNQYKLDDTKIGYIFTDNDPKYKFVVIKKGISNYGEIDVNIDIDDTKYKVLCRDKDITPVYDRGSIEFDASEFGNDVIVAFKYNNDDADLAIPPLSANNYVINLAGNNTIAYKTANKKVTQEDIAKSITDVKVGSEECDVKVECDSKTGIIKLTLSKKSAEQTTPEQTAPEQTAPEQTAPEPTNPVPTTPGQTIPGQTTP